jgi:hypothetical protein
MRSHKAFGVQQGRKWLKEDVSELQAVSETSQLRQRGWDGAVHDLAVTELAA